MEPLRRSTSYLSLSRGTSGADTINGNSSANYIITLAGGDTIDAGDGNDFVGTGSGNDTITGGAGNDSVQIGTVMILSMAEPVTITSMVHTATTSSTAKTEDDILITSGAWLSGVQNTLSGGAGNILFRPAMPMILSMGEAAMIRSLVVGAMMYVYTGGLDQITELGDSDILHIQGGTTINDVTISDYNNSGNDDTKIVINAGTNEIIINNLRHATTNYHTESLKFDDGFITDLLPSYNSWYNGTSGNDTLSGNGSANVLIGFAGDDTINAGAGSRQRPWRGRRPTRSMATATPTCCTAGPATTHLWRRRAGYALWRHRRSIGSC